MHPHGVPVTLNRNFFLPTMHPYGVLLVLPKSVSTHSVPLQGAAHLNTLVCQAAHCLFTNAYCLKNNCPSEKGQSQL